MAFSAFLRRAASASAYSPLFLRSLAAVATTTIIPRPFLRSLPLLSQTHISSPFSSLSKPSVDSHLLQMIDSEIKCAKECDDHDRVEEIPDGFPFEIQDDERTNVITLKRKYQGKENIEVVVSMPSLVTGEEPEDERERSNGEDEDEEEERERANQPSIPITVIVSKDGAGPVLEFDCTAYPDLVRIDSLSVRENRVDGDEMVAYEGPDFEDLDENLQKAFHKYLELRGINPLTTNFLHEYMINKDSREYLLWLCNLKKFIGK